jgi:uncharacterized protein YigE (DUF2233 family)
MDSSIVSCAPLFSVLLTSAVIRKGKNDIAPLSFEEGVTNNINFVHIKIDPSKFSFEVLSREQAGKLTAQEPFLLINGGYVDVNDKPCGLLVSQGQTISPFSDNHKFSAVFAINNGKAAITRSKDFKLTEHTTFALQNGPFIIEPGKRPGIKPNATEPAERTLLALDKKGMIHFFILKGPISLYNSQDLLLKKVKNIDAALNLDGGPISFFKLDMLGAKGSFGHAEQPAYFIKIAPLK